MALIAIAILGAFVEVKRESEQKGANEVLGQEREPFMIKKGTAEQGFD
jgi:hypothetical protein